MSEQLASSPMVSCVICFFNEEKYILTAIESLFGQTYTDYELILVNDGSIDGSVQIAKNTVATYPDKVRYYEHPDGSNRGTAASRNLGIQLAQGKYICFLDADDAWLPDKLFAHVTLLEKNSNAMAIISPLTIWLEDGSRYIEQMAYSAGLLAPQSLIEGMLQSDNNIPSLSSLIRTSILQKDLLIDESFNHVYEDAVFFSMISLRHWVYFDSNSYHLYRMNPESITHTVTQGDRKAAQLAFMGFLIDQLARNEAYELFEVANKRYLQLYDNEMSWSHSDGTIRCIEKNRTPEGIQIVKDCTGHQLYGPYLFLKAGIYKAILRFSKGTVMGIPHLDVCSDGGDKIHGNSCIASEDEVSIEFRLEAFCNDLEIRLDGGGEFSGIYLGMKIVPLSN